jgi:hypothetical protein
MQLNCDAIDHRGALMRSHLTISKHESLKNSPEDAHSSRAWVRCLKMEGATEGYQPRVVAGISIYGKM